ncbi:hypothetical protein Fcan01_19481 [Folsomia candida]|uniref:Uncharacterized protein n=1 Tax=Folsomia candida TaxID=158441 RepID=A0A226DN39_FOLCA|nr:hypothetical protein Fcan01_19481 [Folsomia candida]
MMPTSNNPGDIIVPLSPHPSAATASPANEISKLLYQFDGAENLPGNKIPNTKLPGSRQNATYDFGREASRYYAIRTLGQSQSTGVETILALFGGGDLKVKKPSEKLKLAQKTRLAIPRFHKQLTNNSGHLTRFDNNGGGYFETTKARGTTTRATTTTITTVKPSTFAPRGTDALINHWFETTEGIITISVFGGAVLTLSFLGEGFTCGLSNLDTDQFE